MYAIRSYYVTGGAGYIGSLLTSELLRAGSLVTVVDDLLFGGDSRYNYRFESAFEIRLKNAKDEAVTVTVVEPVPGDWKVLSESRQHRKGAANAAVWDVPVPAKGEATLTYRVEVNY